MREGIIFARAGLADAGEIHALQRLAFGEEGALYQDLSLPPLTEPESATARAIEEGLVLKALVNDRLAGSVRGAMKAETCLVGRLVVDPDLRGQGIGTRLMEELEARFPQAKRFEIFTGHKSLKPLRLYEKMGYRQCRTQAVHSGLTLVFMDKIRVVPSSRNADSPCGFATDRPNPSHAQEIPCGKCPPDESCP